MQIVIDIPKEEYKRVMDGKWEGNDLADYIENGLPIPKGHGRLGDLDRLSKKFLRKDVKDFNENLEALAGWFLRTCNHEDTIIEADTESEDKE